LFRAESSHAENAEEILIVAHRIAFLCQGIGSQVGPETAIAEALACQADLDLTLIRLPEERKRLALSYPGEAPGSLQQLAILDALRTIEQGEFDVVLVLNGFAIHRQLGSFFLSLKRLSTRVVAWQIDDPYYIDTVFPFVEHVDLILTVDDSTIDIYSRYNKSAVYLPLGGAPTPESCNFQVPKLNLDICLIATPFALSRRVRLINQSAEFLARFRTLITGASSIDRWPDRLSKSGVLEHCVEDRFVPPEEAATIHRTSRVSLNIHKDSWGHPWDRNSHRVAAMSPSERTFVLACAGAFQLVDNARPNLESFFRINEEIVTFEDVGDFQSKIQWFLTHEERRKEIARAMQARALAEHTYQHRLQTLLAAVL
jgi:spore maturation protein CgeB